MKLSNYFWQQIQKKIPNVSLNGPEIGDRRLPNNLNITFPHIEAEKFLLYLDRYGISCSAGSACAAEEGEPSHVLSAIGRTLHEVAGSLRFTLGKNTTKQDIDYTSKIISFVYPILDKRI